MSLEQPENQREVSDSEWQQLKEDAAYWEERIETAKTPSRSYKHILRNLSASLSGLMMLAEKKNEHTAHYYDRAIKNVELIKRYFKLLEDYPEFAEKELVPGEGYFSIDATMEHLETSLSEPLIEEYEKRLKEKSEQ